ncbi:ATP-binding cassette sub-family C member 3-like [Bacillus rossius redtenbacheri]|uniref:ATP-binding cassette sub-family C member 3-like n=1 Tax=Bacillus rossius redtenbacheri TaxID=93214 RepID=UPI002FDD2876
MEEFLNGPIDKYCGSKFWDSNLTWSESDPDLTPCFQKTALVWLPCTLLLALSPIEASFLMDSQSRRTPWTALNVSKLLLTSLLIVVCLADLGFALSLNNQGYAIYAVDVYTPVVKLVALAICAVLQYYNKKQGQRTSGVLFIFWLFMAVCGVVQFRYEIRQLQQQVSPDPYFPVVSYIMFYIITLVIFLLSFFMDAVPKVWEYEGLENPAPEIKHPFPVRLLFVWFDTFVWNSYRVPIKQENLWDLKPEEASRSIAPSFDRHWDKVIGRNSQMAEARARFHKNSGSMDLARGKKAGLRQPSVLPSLCRAFGPIFFCASALGFINLVVTFANPQLLGLVISFVSSNEPIWLGVVYAVLMFVFGSLQPIINSHFNLITMKAAVRIRVALIAVIYRKALTMSNNAKKLSTVGEIVNLMSVDTARIVESVMQLNWLWLCPLQILVALYFLWQLMGVAVLAGTAVMILMVPVNVVIANKAKNLQIAQMKIKDQRIKLMNEILNGIKVLKLYAWEGSYEKIIERMRDKEVKILKTTSYLNAGTSFIWTCAPLMVSLMTFMTYIFLDSNNVLDSQKAFVSLTLFNLMRGPLAIIPMLITTMIQAGVSVKRISKYLCTEDLDMTAVSHDSYEKHCLKIDNGTFTWGVEEEPTLRNINVRVQSGALVAVVGTVGSGKSSLVSALLGEMDKKSGSVNTVGSIAYVPQQAWIQHATLRDNITFGTPFDHARYQRVIDACALRSDLAILPGGDQIEIGEKGINLSGGQKQRVSLARAVYRDCDVYLLDDPLSAVDSHVGKHIFEKVIGPTGLLRNKTRVLVTHGITFLPRVDLILVLKDGQVSETGTYQELVQRRGAFAEFLDQHLQDILASDAAEQNLEEVKQQLESSLGAEEFQRKLSRAMSRVSESRSQAGSLADIVSALRSRSGSVHSMLSVASNKSRASKRRARNASESSRMNGGSILQLEGINEPDMAGQKLIEDEKIEEGNVKMYVFKYYMKAMSLPMVLGTFIFNALMQFFQVGDNAWLSVWSENMLGTVNETTGLVESNPQELYLGVYGAMGFGQSAGAVLGTLAISLGTLHAAKVLHASMLANIMRLPQSLFDTTPSGRILNRFSTDVNVLDLSFPMFMRFCIPYIYRLIGTLIVICYSTPIFMAVVVPIGVLYYFIQRIYVATVRQVRRIESASRAPIFSHFEESITGAPTIRAYRVQEAFIKKSEQHVDNNQKAIYPAVICNGWLTLRVEFIGAIITFFAALFSVLNRDTTNAGLVGLSISYALQVTMTLSFLVRTASDVETNIVAVERIKEYTELEQEAPWEVPEHPVPADWPAQGQVEFRDYQLRYREGLDLVLKGINVTIQGGEKVGIVGRTGAGKSSLTLALFRIVEPAGGTIYIDGVDITKIGLHDLRSRVTIIPQDPVLFSGPMRRNLDPFDRLSDEAVWTALEQAHLKDFVKSLPAGLNHEVSEAGENLSVGQRQLICLARALLRKTKVLVLDEATAAVDLETDDLIQETIKLAFKDCTILTIAHRLNTILDYNRVIVLDKGCMIEFDSPENLLKDSSSVFHGMAKDAGLV